MIYATATEDIKTGEAIVIDIQKGTARLVRSDDLASDDSRPLRLERHPQSTPWWRRVLQAIVRPRMSRTAIEEMENLRRDRDALAIKKPLAVDCPNCHTAFCNGNCDPTICRFAR